MNEEILIADVTNKLEELGSLVDNDLPKYIVTLITNQNPINRIRSELSLFLDSVNGPFMDWLEVYLQNKQQSNDPKRKLEVIAASEIEDEELLDFEEEPLHQQENEPNELNESELNELNQNEFSNEELNSSLENSNKRKLEENEQINDLESNKKKLMIINDEIKLNKKSENVISLKNKSTLNDIGKMRLLLKKAEEEKLGKQPPQQNVPQQSQQNTTNQSNNFDLREKLNSSRQKRTQTEINEFKMEDDSEQKTDEEDEKKERCKFWPLCKKESECIFVHPTQQCKQFPSCKLGDKCLYIHPLCKFDAICAKNDCPYLHITKKQNLVLQTNVPQIECKFYPNCYNLNCPFIHPKMCMYGAMCKNPTCLFKHPEKAQNIAKPHQLKWTSKNLTNSNETAPTITENSMNENNEHFEEDELNTSGNLDDEAEINIKTEHSDFENDQAENKISTENLEIKTENL